MSSTAMPQSTPITARINLKHDAEKHKTLAHQIHALDRHRIKKYEDGKCAHGPSATHDETVRAHVLSKKPYSNKSTTIDVTDAVVTYTIEVGVGSKDTKYTLLNDTGSSNTFVGSNRAYVKSHDTSKDTGNTIKVSYGSGSFTGEEYTDRVALSSSLVIKNQGLGVTTKDKAQGFDDVDGILCIGPVALTVGTVSDNQPVPTVTDNLHSQGLIPKNSLAISYIPTVDSAGTLNGELTIGGEDSSKYTGDLELRSASSSGFKPILSKTAGIVDTGTTLLYLSSDAFAAYKGATGAELDSTTGLLRLTSDQFKNLGSLHFTIGETTYEMVPDAQIWPRALNPTLGGDADAFYLVAADSGSKSGIGLDFINGFAWLQRFYTVYDTQNSQIGIANTPYTSVTTNFDSSSSSTSESKR